MTLVPAIRIDASLRAYIDPLTPDEYQALERSLLDEGCRDALVLWGDLLVDGHNRYEICTRHGIAFRTTQNERFTSMDDVHLWMIDNHLGRRSVSDFQRGELALRKRDILMRRVQQANAESDSQAEPGEAVVPPTVSREALARAARLSGNTLGRIERIRETAAPSLVQAARAGDISINAAAVLATLPEAEQETAAAGGRQALREAARKVREARAPRRPSEPVFEPLEEIEDYPAEVTRLRRLVEALYQERDQLKKKSRQSNRRAI